MYQPIHTGRRAGHAHWIRILAVAASLSACLVSWPDPATAQTDTDGDGSPRAAQLLDLKVQSTRILEGLAGAGEAQDLGQ